jgi:hypothetical protein
MIAEPAHGDATTGCSSFHVLSTRCHVTAFIIAYELRFHSGIISSLIPITKGLPPLQQ